MAVFALWPLLPVQAGTEGESANGGGFFRGPGPNRLRGRGAVVVIFATHRPQRFFYADALAERDHAALGRLGRRRPSRPGGIDAPGSCGAAPPRAPLHGRRA